MGLRFEVALCFTAALLITSIHVLLRLCTAFGKILKSPSAVRTAWLVFKSSLSSLSGCSSRNEVENAVREKLLVNQVAAFRLIIDVMANCLLFNTCSMMYKLPLGFRGVKPLQDIVVLGNHLIFLLPHRFPHLINGKSVDLWYSWVMACAATALGACPEDLLPVLLASTMLVCLAVSFARLHGPIVVVWNGVYAAAAGYIFSASACPHKVQYTCVVCVFAVLVCILTALVEERWKAEIRSGIEARSLQQKESAASALLSIFYEAVVELDSDLVITNVENQLAWFLMFGPGRTLQGSRLEELLLDEEERQLFRQRMHQKLDKREAMANVLHVAMRKGDGSRIQVELFSFQFEGCSGRMHHLIGIREFSDERVVEPGPLADDQEGSLHSQGEEVWVTINSAEPDLPILECSEGFQQHVSPVTGGCGFCGLVERAKELQDWFQFIVNMHAAGQSRTRVQSMNSMSVLLRPHGQPNVRVQATCCVVLTEEESQDEDETYLLRLSFSNLQRVVVVKGRKRSSAGSSTGSGTAPSKVSAVLHSGQSKTDVDSSLFKQAQLLPL